ncbi:MAG: DUF3047 domain-containing protein [Aquabacterium sp.]
MSPAWRFVGLPSQSLPRTVYGIVRLPADGVVLRAEADASYGNLFHPTPDGRAGTLTWRWRLDQPNAATDLRQKSGDDAALKVCALFDLPLSAVPFVERQLLRVARMSTPDPLPAATVCYQWEPRLPQGTVLDNAYSRRVRIMVLRGQEASGLQWHAERRDLAADFMRLFGDEAAQVPPLLGIAVGADADNTRGRSIGHLADLALP